VVISKLRDQPRAAALVTKLALLTDLGLFPRTQLASTFADFIGKRVSLKLSDLPTDEVKSALAEIIIIQLHGYALRGEQPRQLKRMMIFDEAHRVRDSRRLEALAREGRAFGVGIVIGTQFPGDIPETMAGNLATQLFLMNNQAQHRRYVVKQVFGTTSGNEPRKLLDNLKKLKQFEGYFSNAHQSALVSVTPHYKRQ
jgi:DNA helicase HerA-like ATPase